MACTTNQPTKQAPSPFPPAQVALGVVLPQLIVVQAHSLIDPRRIVSPGRVSPIDPDGSPSGGWGGRGAGGTGPVCGGAGGEEGLDLRLCLRGRDGRCVIMELDSTVLCESNAFFAAMAPPKATVGGGGKRIEVDGLENVEAFKETVELMFEPDAMRRLVRAGMSRAIGVLEVASSIMFDRGIKSCLEYIEAVPWNERRREA